MEFTKIPYRYYKRIIGIVFSQKKIPIFSKVQSNFWKER